MSSNFAIPLVVANGGATSSQSAPDTRAPVLNTAAKLSESMAILSMKLMQVGKPSEAYQNYLSDIERFLALLAQQLDADSACTSDDGVPITEDVQLQSQRIDVIGEISAVNFADSRVRTGIEI